MTHPRDTSRSVLEHIPLVNALCWYQHIIHEHTQQTAILAYALARQLRLSKEETHLISLAAFVHDIGKIAVPAAILNKPGPLSEHEWAIVRCHPEIGSQLLQQAGGMWTFIASLVLAHHERWDGRGYPYGLAKEAIPLGARILAIVDAYDAMTGSRPYRRTLSPAEARAEVRRCAGSAYDPRIVDSFLRMDATDHLSWPW